MVSVKALSSLMAKLYERLLCLCACAVLCRLLELDIAISRSFTSKLVRARKITAGQTGLHSHLSPFAALIDTSLDGSAYKVPASWSASLLWPAI